MDIALIAFTVLVMIAFAVTIVLENIGYVPFAGKRAERRIKERARKLIEETVQETVQETIQATAAAAQEAPKKKRAYRPRKRKNTAAETSSQAE